MTGLWSRLPLAGKMFLVCALLAMTASSVGNVLFYREASDCLREEVRQRVVSLASTIASQVSPSLHAQIRDPADESSAAYRQITAVLRKARMANPEVRHVYTVRPTSNGRTWRYVIDSKENPKLQSHVGETYDAGNSHEISSALLTPSADKNPTESQSGTWLCGYAPIKDGRGRAEAVVGVDISAGELYAALAGLERAQGTNVLVCTALAVALGWATTLAGVKVLRTFGQAAERVRAGDLDFQLEVSRADEIGKFTETFNQMIVGLRLSRERLKESTSVDLMTGLANHVHFHGRLEDEIERASLQGGELCVLLMDVDKFTLINDAFGHDVGDGLVQQVASVLSRSVRKTDVVARLGGDDFAVILSDVGVVEGLEMAERLRANVEEHGFQNVPADVLPIDAPSGGEGSVHLTITAGMAAYPAHHSTKDGIVMAAEIALCQAQRSTHNTVCVFDHGDTINEGIDPDDLYQVLRDPSTAALQSLAAAIDARDTYTQGHSERVSHYAQVLAQWLEGDPAIVDRVRVAGLVHDLGKLGIPDAILSKPSHLTPEEQEIIRGHPSLGESILRRAHQLEQVIPAVLCHHERWDGAGYPNGLAGEDVPLLARMIGVADAFDAMTTARPYRPALSLEQAFSELRMGAGKQFDPSLVEPFIKSLSAEQLGRAA